MLSMLGTSDVRSEGFGVGDPPVSATQHGAGVLTGGQIPAIPYTSQSKTWGAAPSQPVRDVLDITATNVSAVTIDAARAKVDCAVQLNVTPDGPLSVAELHKKIEAMKLAYADLGRYNGDPRFAKIPVRVIVSK